MFLVNRKSVFQGLMVFIFALGLLFPAGALVLAEDGTTPDGTTTEVVTSDGTTTDTTAPTGDAPTGESTEVAPPTEEASSEPVVTEEVPAASVVTEAAPVTDPLPPPVVETAVEEAAPAAEPVAEVVTALAESNAVVLDTEGNPVPLASEEAVTILTVPDPWVVRGGVTYHFMANCTGMENCTTSATPVQAAINFADTGETVFLGAGTFEEELEISKDITIKGTTGTIIKSPSVLDTDFTTTSAKKAIVYVNNANVVIDGLTVDGAGRGNANNSFIGIAYYNAGGTVQNSIIQGIRDSTFSGAQHGVGIYAFNNDGVDRTLNILNNIVTDFQKNGMALIGNDHLTVNVENNTVEGHGPTTITAQNGIQVDGVTGKINNNTVNGINYTRDHNWTATGILVYDSNIEIGGNALNGNQTGIYVYSETAGKTANIHHNIVIGDPTQDYGWGVIADGEVTNGMTATIANNVVSNYLYGVEVWGGALNGASANITGNNIYDNYLGIAVDGGGYVGSNFVYRSNYANANITGNKIHDNDYGVYTLNPLTTVNFNALVDNGVSIYYDYAPAGQSTPSTVSIVNPLDATNNFWGSNEGSEITNMVYGNINFTPWLWYDPTIDNGGGDGGGGDGGPTGPVPPLPVAPPPVGGAPGLIPVTGGQFVKLSCDTASTLQLSDDNQVQFINTLCGYEGALTGVETGTLPAALPEGTFLASGMTVTLTKEGTPVPTGESMVISFKIPAGMEGKTFSIMVWDATLNGGAGGWMEVPGGSLNNGFFEATINYTGTFVLVFK